MDTLLEIGSGQGSGPLEIELLSEQELLEIGGGLGPLGAGLLIAGAGLGALAAGVAIGVAVYYFTHD